MAFSLQRLICFGVLIVVFWQNTSSDAFCDDPIPLTIESYANGKKYSFVVSNTRFKKSPNSDEIGDVPYSPQNAIKKAFSQLRTLLPNSSDYDIDCVCLEKQKSTGKWYFRVQFIKSRGLSDGSIPVFMIVVLLDGTIVDPIESSIVR